jgi:hypothetical protein
VIGAVRRAWDRFRGSGEAAVTVPPMDGALRPNQRLEEGAAVMDVAGPDNLARAGGRTFFSSGNAVHELLAGNGGAREIRQFGVAVTALAATGEDSLAVGLDDGRIVLVGGPWNDRTIDGLGGRKLICPTALSFASSHALLVAQGSAERRPSEWKADVMERCRTGSVWCIDLADGKTSCLADRLSWPYGLAATPDGGIAVSESWRHRVVLLGRDRKSPEPVLEDLPGYPARLVAAAEGGYWLCIFAPRNQLIEFVQREDDFRRRMMTEIDPDYWVAPSLAPADTFLQPLQGGAQKHLGMLKPWAPTRSYGLVLRLDAGFQPVASHHSRADGRRHGVTSCVEVDGRLIVGSKGGGVIFTLETSVAESEREARHAAAH